MNLAVASRTCKPPQEAIAIAERGIEVARSTGRHEAAQATEEWLDTLPQPSSNAPAATAAFRFVYAETSRKNRNEPPSQGNHETHGAARSHALDGPGRPCADLVLDLPRLSCRRSTAAGCGTTMRTSPSPNCNRSGAFIAFGSSWARRSSTTRCCTARSGWSTSCGATRFWVTTW